MSRPKNKRFITDHLTQEYTHTADAAGISQLYKSDLNSQNFNVIRKTNEFDNPNSYLNNSSVVKTATHKRRNISIGIDRAGLDTAQQNISRSIKINDQSQMKKTSTHLNR